MPIIHLIEVRLSEEKVNNCGCLVVKILSFSLFLTDKFDSHPNDAKYVLDAVYITSMLLHNNSEHQFYLRSLITANTPMRCISSLDISLWRR
jgi:hypothetical protein